MCRSPLREEVLLPANIPLSEEADKMRSVHCRYTPVADRCFPHHAIASLHQVGGPDAPALRMTFSTLIASRILSHNTHTPSRGKGSDMRAIFSMIRLRSRKIFDDTLFRSLNPCFQRREITKPSAKDVMDLTLLLKQFGHSFGHFSQLRLHSVQLPLLDLQSGKHFLTMFMT